MPRHESQWSRYSLSTNPTVAIAPSWASASSFHPGRFPLSKRPRPFSSAVKPESSTLTYTRRMMSLLSLVKSETLKGFLTFFTPCSYFFVCKGTFPPELGPLLNFKGVLSTSALLADSLHTTVLSLLILSVARTLKGLCAFLSLKGYKCPLGNLFSSTPCWACRVFSNPVKVFPWHFFSLWTQTDFFYALYAPNKFSPGRVLHNP